MSARYLFGDSGLFPGTNNFLEILRAFVTHGGRVAMIQAEIAAKERTVGEAVSLTSKQLDAAAAYFDIVIPEISKLGKAREPEVRPLATELSEFAQRLHESTRSRALAELESTKNTTAREIAGLKAEIPVCLNNFFVQSPLEEKAWAFSMHRTAESVDTSTVITFPQGLEAAFTLDPEAEWSHPRRVSELACDVNIQVGMKKKFLSKALVPDRNYLNDYFIASVELTEDIAELLLKRKLEAEEGLIIRLVNSGDEPPLGEIIRAGDDEILAASPEDTAELRRLVDALRDTVKVSIRRRHRLLWVRLDERDVIEHDLLTDMLERLVDALAPLAQEICRRSPNRHELSLKVEHDDGHREEIYLKKDDLAEPLAGLPVPIWNMFSRLGILPAAS